MSRTTGLTQQGVVDQGGPTLLWPKLALEVADHGSELVDLGGGGEDERLHPDVIRAASSGGIPRSAVHVMPTTSPKSLGAILSQDIGYTDANVLFVGQELLVCRGDGLLSLGRPSADGFAGRVQAKPVAGRCWSAPTVLGDTVIVRSDKELARVKLSSLVADFRGPADSGVSALDAAYAPKSKSKVPDM